MSYGIDRVPRDVDPTSETMAALEGAEIVVSATAGPRDPSNYRECRRCGQMGYVGAYPFSTVYSPNRRCLCDDCV